jgi:hypothetical protein
VSENRFMQGLKCRCGSPMINPIWCDNGHAGMAVVCKVKHCGQPATETVTLEITSRDLVVQPVTVDICDKHLRDVGGTVAHLSLVAR